MSPLLSFGPVRVSSYGALSAAATVLSVLWLKRHREKMGLSENRFWGAVWFLLLGAALGAKGLFLILGWEHFATGQIEFLRDFGVGWVFFGGLLGATLFGWIFANRYGLDFGRGADFFAVALPLGHAVGRVGCFAAGCCHGATSGLPWSVSYTHPACLIPPAFRGLSLHPVQLYEAAGLLIIAWSCQTVLRRRCPGGTTFRLYLVLYGVLRVLLEPFRGDGRPERWWGLSHQQGMALALVAGTLLWEARSRVLAFGYGAKRFETDP